MFINDQWRYSDLSGDFIDWTDNHEATLDFLPEHDFLIFF